MAAATHSLYYEQYSDLYSHVSIGSQHITDVSGVRELPPKDVLNDDDGLVRWRFWFHYISLSVFQLDLLTKPSIVHPVTDVTGAWVCLICHLLTDRQIDRQTEGQIVSQLKRGNGRVNFKKVISQ